MSYNKLWANLGIYLLVWGLSGNLSFAMDSQSTAPTDSHWFKSVDKINVSNIDLGDFLQGIAIQNGLNLIVDQSINSKVSLHLNKIKIWDLIEYLAEEYQLSLQWKQGILSVVPIDLSELKKTTRANNLKLETNLSSITLECHGIPINTLVDSLSKKTPLNILVDPNLSDPITGELKDVPIVEGVTNLLKFNGFNVRNDNGILFISPSKFAGDSGKRKFQHQSVIVNEDSTISFDLQEAKIGDVLEELTAQVNIPIISYSSLAGNITAKTDHLTLDQTLTYLLRNTNSTYRKENEVYFIGDKSMRGMATTELVRLNHIKSSGVVDILPRSILNNIEIKEVKEMNSLVLIGTRDIVDEATEYIGSIDQLTPQILIEALVVDIQNSNVSEYSLKMGVDSSQGNNIVSTLFPFLEGTFTKTAVSNGAKSLGLPVGVSQGIGKLPTGFYVNLKALEQEGFIKIQSKPHIATLNGHKASLVISTTQYYIFDSEVIIPSTGQPTTQKTQRFEKISAEIKLEITPWVSADNEITVDIHPEFSIPVGTFSPNIPPTISSRILDSTVRLKDGETIVLGGLIQSSENKSDSKFPVLSEIPWVGKLFRNHTNDSGKSELVIYLTPHLLSK